MTPTVYPDVTILLYPCQPPAKEEELGVRLVSGQGSVPETAVELSITPVPAERDQLVAVTSVDLAREVGFRTGLQGDRWKTEWVRINCS